MSFDNLETDDVSSEIEEEGGTPEEASNRTFLIVAGVFGAIVVLSLICLVLVIVFKVVPGNKNTSKSATQQALINQETIKGATQTQLARLWTATPTQTSSPMPATPTPNVTDTPVIKPSSTPTSPNAATMEYLYKMATETKAALGKASPTVTVQSTLGKYGFADQVGAPALLGLAVVLVVVIFLARRLRTANS
jgi:cytoskeletal protein RodZ